MAKSFNESIDNLSDELHDLSKLIRDVGDKKLKSLFKSKEYTEAAKSVAAVNKYESAIGILRRAEDVREAKLAMRRKPDRWASPSEYLEWRDIRKRQKGLGIEYVQGQKRAFAEYSRNRGGVIPSLLRNSISKYGAKGGRQAFQDAVNDRLLQISDPTAYAYEQERRMYGTENAQRFQEAREEKERHKQQMAWNLFNMSDKDRFLREAQERFGTPERAEEAYKKELKKNLPAFFKESKANTKNLERMSKAFSYAKGIPGLGRIASMGPVGAGVALGTAAIATTTGIFNQIDKANSSAVRWENATRFYGAPSEDERRAMFLAGIGDPAKQSEIYGRLTARFGSFQNAMRVFSRFEKMPDGTAKIMALQSMASEGLTPETLAMAGFYAGTTTTSRARKMAGALDVQRVATQLGIKSGSKEGVVTQAGLMFMPDSWLARMGSVGDIFEGQNLDKINQAKEIASTGIKYDSQGAVNSSVSNITNGDTIYNNYITVPDAGQIGPAIESATDGSRKAVDRQKKMDAVATGVLQ